MANNVDINIVHERVLQIAVAFHEILTKHHIPYYMLGGSMLGAIRHKGFIPWDDDMDFGVPRSFYDQAITVLEDELPSYYRVLKATNGEAVYDGCKIEDKRTIVEEEDSVGIIRGLNIDIFPLDSGNNKWGICSWNWWVKHIMGINIYKYMWPKTLKEQWVAIMVRLFPRNYFHNIARLMIHSQGEYYINYGGYWGPKEIVRKDIMGTPTLYQFENIKLYGSEDYDGYLKCLYNNYMQLPPENKRHIHIKSIKYTE